MIRFIYILLVNWVFIDVIEKPVNVILHDQDLMLHLKIILLKIIHINRTICVTGTLNWIEIT